MPCCPLLADNSMKPNVFSLEWIGTSRSEDLAFSF